MPESQPTQVTSASAWAAEADQGIVVPLPSGKVVKVRRTMDMMTLVKTGQVPNALSGIIQDAINKASQGKPVTADIDLSILGEGDNLQELIWFQEDMIARMMVEPKAVVPPRQGRGKNSDGTKVPPDETDEAFAKRVAAFRPNVEAGEISTEWMSDDDKNFLFSLGQGGPMDLERFRAEQGGAVAPVPAGKAVAGAAKRTPRPAKIKP